MCCIYCKLVGVESAIHGDDWLMERLSIFELLLQRSVARLCPGCIFKCGCSRKGSHQQWAAGESDQ